MATAVIPSSKISGGSFLIEDRIPSEVFTPEDFSEQHLLIAQTAEDFAVNEIVPNIKIRTTATALPIEVVLRRGRFIHGFNVQARRSIIYGMS